jgi:hypothetical protein
VSAIAELELPAFDYGDDTLKRPRFQRAGVRHPLGVYGLIEVPLRFGDP